MSDLNLDIVRFCARECELQQSGERSVGWMAEAWLYAQMMAPVPPTVDDVLELGRLVEPVKNGRGFRQVGVRVGWNVKGPWQHVPGQIEALCAPEVAKMVPPAEWFYSYEEVHPFVDGNGRTGQILFNWLNHSLDTPEWAPDFWDDPRRMAGDGA